VFHKVIRVDRAGDKPPKMDGSFRPGKSIMVMMDDTENNVTKIIFAGGRNDGLCYTWLNRGFCERGENCKFSHPVAGKGKGREFSENEERRNEIRNSMERAKERDNNGPYRREEYRGFQGNDSRDTGRKERSRSRDRHRGGGEW
jgi:hypothetical protein